MSATTDKVRCESRNHAGRQCDGHANDHFRHTNFETDTSWTDDDVARWARAGSRFLKKVGAGITLRPRVAALVLLAASSCSHLAAERPGCTRTFSRGRECEVCQRGDVRTIECGGVR